MSLLTLAVDKPIWLPAPLDVLTFLKMFCDEPLSVLAIVPEVVMVPPLSPSPAVIEVTVPAPPAAHVTVPAPSVCK